VDFSFTKEQIALQKMAREFAEKRLAPREEEIRKQGTAPQDILDEMAELELFGLCIPEEYGGSDVGSLTYMLVLEEIASVAHYAAIDMSTVTMGATILKQFGTEEQRKKYLPQMAKGKLVGSFAFTEPQTGSDPVQLTTTYKKDGDNYILNGTKRFITNGAKPGPAVIFARDGEQMDKVIVSAFLVDKMTEGYTVSEPWEMAAGPKTLVDVYLKDVKVPLGNMLYQEGKGFDVLRVGIAMGKITTATNAMVIIKRSYEEACKYGMEKLHRGKPIAAKFQSIQIKIAELRVMYETARLLCHRLGYAADHIMDFDDFAVQGAIAKVFCGDHAVLAARLATDVHGSYGLMADYPISHIYQEAITSPEYEGVSDMQRIIIANATLFGKKMSK